MLKMFGLLPSKIKGLFLLGIIIILINVVSIMVIPVFLSQFLPLIAREQTSINETYQVILFERWIIFESLQRSEVIVELLLTSIGLIAIAVVTNISAMFLTTWAGEQASMFYRNYLFLKYQKLSLKDISDLGQESLINRISSDVASFWDFLISATNALIKAPLFIIVGFVFALITNVNLSWAIAAAVPLNIGILLFIFIKANPLIAKNRRNLDLITKDVSESIIGARVVKVYNLQNKQKQKFNISNNRWYKVESKAWTFLSLGNPVFFSIINILIVLIYIVAAHQLAAEQMPTPQIVAKVNVFIEYEVLISQGIIIFAQFLGTVFKARVSAKRYQEILNRDYIDLFVEKGFMLDKATKENNFPVIFKNVNFKYFDQSKEYVIENVNFELPNKHTLGIIGPTGSGKSTIANLLVNNMLLKEGSIQVGGIDVNKINTHELHSKVGIVFQEPLLYSGTIRENLLFANPKATDEDIEKALKSACAWDFVNSFADKLDHYIEQRGKNLSGGQKQRLSIARTLLLNPKVLILDDSTSALDNLTTKELLWNISKNYDCTTIIISQKINSIKHANEILVLSKGQTIGKGTHEELLQECEWYKQVYQNQVIH
ncbi:ABC transporter ATP-binding protein [Mycoplasmopsis sturni]|uniref:ABC transporter ATP-binding protein n=1 Tax=Mycoplasmopsis sturni TaxID=39047 RepID=UPI000569E1C5|nr:ABC transporter ATP-binding protein [Mycoplasmopsis sturni]